MSVWKEVVIDELCSEITDCVNKTAPSVEYVTPFKMIRTTNIKKGRINLDEVRYVTEETYRTWIRRGAPQLEDIILTREAPVGEVGMIRTNQKVFLGQRTMMYRADRSKADPYFLYYAFQTEFVQEQIHAAGMGSVVEHVRVPDAKKFKINIPPLPEQKAIASVLSSLDDKIDLLHHQNKTLEAMAETLFHQWFIEEAKEDWDDVTISNLIEVRDGTHDSPKQASIGFPLVTSKHIGNGVLDFESCYLISEVDYEKVNSRSQVETFDILMSMIGTLGRTYLEFGSVSYAIKNIGLFKTSRNPQWKYFIYLWLNSSLGKQFIDEHKSGSTQEYLSLGSLRSIQFKKPPTDVLKQFNGLVDDMFQKIYANINQLQTLEKLRDTLLPKLMSGEVRVEYKKVDAA
jgi:type I restriction enzyme S subunit